MYGRQVQGPVDVLEEAWEASKQSDESMVSYFLAVQEKMATMVELVKDILVKSQKDQQQWYDRNAREGGYRKETRC